LTIARVFVENLPYARVIEHYDRPTTFYYIDPPYWQCEDYYGKTLFSRDDFARLAEQLRQIQGRFILSLNDVPEIRVLFAGFHLQPVTCRYSCTQGPAPLARELLVANFALHASP